MLLCYELGEIDDVSEKTYQKTNKLRICNNTNSKYVYVYYDNGTS